MTTYDQTESRVCGCGRRIPVGHPYHVGRCRVNGRPAFRRIERRNGPLFEDSTTGRVLTADSPEPEDQVCLDSPTRRHEPHPERWGDNVCVWCLDAVYVDPATQARQVVTR